MNVADAHREKKIEELYQAACFDDLDGPYYAFKEGLEQGWDAAVAYLKSEQNREVKTCKQP